MDAANINLVSFYTEKIDDSSHQLGMLFLNEQKEISSVKTFIFKQAHAVNNHKIVDLFTKNGSCSTKSVKNGFFKKLFTEKELEEAKKACMQIGDYSGAKVCVFDFQHCQHGYKEKGQEAITAAEAHILDFLKSDSQVHDKMSETTKKVHAFFHNAFPFDFVILEGKLKCDILKKGGFTQAEADFFNTKGAGSQYFCQCAEFFMNGFKFGLEVDGFTTSEYIKPISPKFSSLPISKVSMVLYPVLYKQMYNADGAFAKALQPIFIASGEFDHSTEITTLNLEKKK